MGYHLTHIRDMWQFYVQIRLNTRKYLTRDKLKIHAHTSICCHTTRLISNIKTFIRDLMPQTSFSNCNVNYNADILKYTNWQGRPSPSLHHMGVPWKLSGVSETSWWRIWFQKQQKYWEICRYDMNWAGRGVDWLVKPRRQSRMSNPQSVGV